jgi:hypothetical protein
MTTTARVALPPPPPRYTSLPFYTQAITAAYNEGLQVAVLAQLTRTSEAAVQKVLEAATKSG